MKHVKSELVAPDNEPTRIKKKCEKQRRAMSPVQYPEFLAVDFEAWICLLLAPLNRTLHHHHRFSQIWTHRQNYSNILGVLVLFSLLSYEEGLGHFNTKLHEKRNSSLQVLTAQRPFKCSCEVIFLTIKLYMLDIWFVKRILKAIPNILSTNGPQKIRPNLLPMLKEFCFPKRKEIFCISWLI